MAGEVIHPHLRELRLDGRNPRLPDSLTAGTQVVLREYIEKEYNPIEVARSIAEHGYFLSEPLIVMRTAEDRYTVLEGNRRLVALQLLADPTQIPNDSSDAEEWAELARLTDLTADERIPAVLVPSRKAVAPIIGYRHISGIEQWDAFAKARFVARFVDEEKMDFPEVAGQVGGPPIRARERYRNYHILVQARDAFGIDTERAQDEFGFFTRAMNESAVQAFIGAKPPSEVEAGKPPIPKERKREVRELLTWLYGDGKDNLPLITDSRDIRDVGTVLQSAEGVKVLRETGDLHAAMEAAGGFKARLTRNLRHAETDLNGARIDIGAYANEEDVKDLLKACDDVLHELIDTSG